MTSNIFYKNKNVLVTGGSGLLGTHLTNALVKSEANVRSVFNRKAPQIKFGSVDYVQYDLRDYDECRKALNDIDYVFHCAARSLGAEIIKKDPKSLVTPNIVMNSNLLDASIEEKVKKFLFVSSNVVYPVLSHPVREEEATGEFFDLYKGPATMKFFTEKLCDFYSSSYPLECIVARPANYFGPYDKIGKGSHVIPALIERALDKENPFVVWGTGNNVKDFLYVEDVVDGVMGAMKGKITPVNIGGGRGYKLRDIVDTILDLTGHKSNVQYDSSKPDAIMYRVLDTTKSRFVPQTNLRNGLIKTINWHKSLRENIKTDRK